MMNLTRYVARSLNGAQDLNTLDIKADWELVEMLVCEEEKEPLAWVGDGADEEEDEDWELVEINNVVEEDE